MPGRALPSLSARLRRRRRAQRFTNAWAGAPIIDA
jgi:hypothetical protein